LKNSVVELVSRDIVSKGLRAPKISQRGSGHLSMSWENRDGQEVNMIVSATPSDTRRAGLNARSVGRRLMAEGPLPPCLSPVTPVDTAERRRIPQPPHPQRRKQYGETSFVRGGQLPTRKSKQRRTKRQPEQIDPLQRAREELHEASHRMMSDLRNLPESQHVSPNLFCVTDADAVEDIGWKRRLALLATFGPSRNSLHFAKAYFWFRRLVHKIENGPDFVEAELTEAALSLKELWESWPEKIYELTVSLHDPEIEAHLREIEEDRANLRILKKENPHGLNPGEIAILRAIRGER